MVLRQAEFRRRLRAVPERVILEVRRVLEIEAQTLVAEMMAIRPFPEIEIGWTWGKAPAGSLVLGRGGRQGAFVTIYATARTEDYPNGFPAVAAWAEFGTAQRVQKTTGRHTGRMKSGPYFFPVYRANQRRIRTRLSRAVGRALNAV